MEVDLELSSSRARDACSWKCRQRRLSPSDRLFEAGDMACRVRVHKYVCDPHSYSNDAGLCASVE